MACFLFRANWTCLSRVAWGGGGGRGGGGGGTESNLKISILEILVYKMQLEIITSKIFTRFNFIAKPCSKEISMSKFPEWLFSD